MNFISSAFAQAAGGDNGSQLQSAIQQFAPFVLILIVFYFLLIRPQQQRAKQLKESQAGLRRGDRVIAAGGIIGSVAKVISDEEIDLVIAENVRVRVVRNTITAVLAKTEPAKNKPKGAVADIDEEDQETVGETAERKAGKRISNSN